MKMRLEYVIGVFVFAHFASAAQLPVTVYIAPGTAAPFDKKAAGAHIEQKKQQAKDAKSAANALEQGLKSKHGRDKNAWPEAAKASLLEAEARERFLREDADYADDWLSREQTQQDLNDSAEDIRKQLGDKPLIRLVDSPTDATLICEVVARRTWKVASQSTVLFYYGIAAKISAGTTRNADIVNDLVWQGENAWSRHLRILHTYRNDEPFWIVRAKQRGKVRHAAERFSEILNGVVTQNYARLAPSQATQ